MNHGTICHNWTGSRFIAARPCIRTTSRFTRVFPSPAPHGPWWTPRSSPRVRSCERSSDGRGKSACSTSTRFAPHAHASSGALRSGCWIRSLPSSRRTHGAIRGEVDLRCRADDAYERDTIPAFSGMPEHEAVPPKPPKSGSYPEGRGYESRPPLWKGQQMLGPGSGRVLLWCRCRLRSRANWSGD